MPRKQRSKLAAGLFSLACLLALLGVVIWLGAADIFKTTYQRAVFYADVSDGSLGLKTGSFVRINDAQVGRIVDVQFNPDDGRTYYTAEIEQAGAEIHRDGKAVASAGFIGGSQLVVLSRGSESEPLATADNPLEVTPAGFMDALTQLSDKVGAELDREDPEALLGKVHAILDGLDTAAGTVSEITTALQQEIDAERAEALLGKIHTAMNDVKRITSSLRQEMSRDEEGSLLAKVHGTADNVRDTSEFLVGEIDREAEGSAMGKVHAGLDDVTEMTADAKPKVGEALTAVRDTAKRLDRYTEEDLGDLLAKMRDVGDKVLEIAENLREVSVEAREVITVNRVQIDEMIDNMALVSAELKATAKEVRRNPWRLFYRPDDEELRSQNIYDAARAFSQGAEQLDQAVTKLRRLAEAHPEGVPADDEQLERIRRQVEESFSNFTKVERALWDELTK